MLLPLSYWVECVHNESIVTHELKLGYLALRLFKDETVSASEQINMA